MVNVKEEWSNLNTMIIVLKSIMKCELLGLDEFFFKLFFWPCFKKKW
jgi:hypothetical protein